MYDGHMRRSVSMSLVPHGPAADGRPLSRSPAGRRDRVVVVGAGIAGLVAAFELAGRGLDVTVVERAARPGGKMRQVKVGGAWLDAGPTVFTMRWVFEELLAAAGLTLDEELTVRPVEVLARHAWSAREQLDLFTDLERSVDAVGAFAGAAEARRFRGFCAHARRIYETLEEPFIRASRPGTPLELARRAGLRGLGDLWRIDAYKKLWDSLGQHFHDQRLRQLFARYATYCGSSPFQAPATLMLVAHAEGTGVWLVEGGMYRVAETLARLAAERGAAFRFNAEAREIEVRGGRVTGVRLADGDRVPADAVIANADLAALAGGRLGREVARAVPKLPPADRSLSALTLSLLAETEGFPLLRHTVFFSDDYAGEFEDIFRRHRLPRTPTTYVCAQDRGDHDDAVPKGPERLFCIVNAPPVGDTHPFPSREVEECAQRTFQLMERCGLRVHRRPETTLLTTPTDFDRLFPGTGGALYGPASHGMMASFRRAGARTRIGGLYLAGGSVHPGPGVPMAALSGRQAVASLLQDLASTGRSSRAAISGGISTR